MKQKWKRLLSLTLAFSMVLSMLQLGATAVLASEYGEIVFTTGTFGTATPPIVNDEAYAILGESDDFGTVKTGTTNPKALEIMQGNAAIANDIFVASSTNAYAPGDIFWLAVKLDSSHLGATAQGLTSFGVMIKYDDTKVECMEGIADNGNTYGYVANLLISDRSGTTAAYAKSKSTLDYYAKYATEASKITSETASSGGVENTYVYLTGACASGVDFFVPKTAAWHLAVPFRVRAGATGTSAFSLEVEQVTNGGKQSSVEHSTSANGEPFTNNGDSKLSLATQVKADPITVTIAGPATVTAAATGEIMIGEKIPDINVTYVPKTGDTTSAYVADLAGKFTVEAHDGSGKLASGGDITIKAIERTSDTVAKLTFDRSVPAGATKLVVTAKTTAFTLGAVTADLTSDLAVTAPLTGVTFNPSNKTLTFATADDYFISVDGGTTFGTAQTISASGTYVLTSAELTALRTFMNTKQGAEGKAAATAAAIVVKNDSSPANSAKYNVSIAATPAETISYTAETLLLPENTWYSDTANDALAQTAGTAKGQFTGTTALALSAFAGGAFAPAAAPKSIYIATGATEPNNENAANATASLLVLASKEGTVTIKIRPTDPAMGLTGISTGVTASNYDSSKINNLTGTGVVYKVSTTPITDTTTTGTTVAVANNMIAGTASQSGKTVYYWIPAVTTAGSEAFASTIKSASPVGHDAYLTFDSAKLAAKQFVISYAGAVDSADTATANWVVKSGDANNAINDAVTVTLVEIDDVNHKVTITLADAISTTKFYSLTVTNAILTGDAGSVYTADILNSFQAAKSTALSTVTIGSITANNGAAATDAGKKLITFTALDGANPGDKIKVYLNDGTTLLGEFDFEAGKLNYELDQTNVIESTPTDSCGDVWQTAHAGETLMVTRTKPGEGESDAKAATAPYDVPAEKVIVNTLAASGALTAKSDVPLGTTVLELHNWLDASATYEDATAATWSYGTTPANVEIDWSKLYSDADCADAHVVADTTAVATGTYYAKVKTDAAYDLAAAAKVVFIAVTTVEPTYSSAKGNVIGINEYVGVLADNDAVFAEIMDSVVVVVYGKDINGNPSTTIKKELTLSQLTGATNVPTDAADFRPALDAKTIGTYDLITPIGVGALTNVVFGQKLADANTAHPGSSDLNVITVGVIIGAPPSSGGGVSSYSVRFDAGQHGKITDGATTTRYKRGETVSAAPTVEAAEGYKFIGWSLNGKDIVEPVGYTVKNTLIFTAQYEEIKVQKPIEIKDVPAVPTYVSGTGDGTFKPNDGITRSAFVKMLVVAMGKYDATKTYTGSFVDVAPDAWDAQYIACATELGLVSGTGDGAFSPNRPITRAEAAKIIATALSLEQVTDGTMADVSGNWAAGYINALVKAGYMTGSGDGTFKPDTSIQRAESVSVINKSQGFKVTDEIRALIKDMESPFSDVSASDWSFADVLFAAGLIIPAK